MNNLLLNAIFGFIGGLARAFFGLVKHYRINKTHNLKFSYLSITLIGSAFVGMFTSLLLTSSYSLSLVSGYVGMDIIESLIKAYRKKLTL